MQEKYDVVVCGAGPAGLQFARELGRVSTASICVLEANTSLRDNDKSTGATFDEVIEGYNIDRDTVMDTFDNIIFEGPTKQAIQPLSGYVLNFPEFLAFLGEEVKEAGADIFTGVKAEGVLRGENGTVEGVQYSRSTQTGSVKADLTVDATGPKATLTRELGLFDYQETQQAIGLEYQGNGSYETTDSLLFSFTHEYSPGGYAWTFPGGEETFKAGVCWLDDYEEIHGDDLPIAEYVDQWIDEDPRWTMNEIEERHAGNAYVNNSLNKRATDGFMAVGDSVSSINALLGEGIRPGMESASMAVSVAKRALRKNNFDEDLLREYEWDWNRNKGKNWTMQRIIGELLYDFDPEQQDAFVRRVQDLDSNQAENLRRYQSPISDLLYLYPFKLKDLRKIPALLRHVNQHVLFGR